VKVLFDGGPAHGDWIDVIEPLPFDYLIPMQVSTDMLLHNAIHQRHDDPSRVQPMKVAKYRLTKVYNDAGERGVIYRWYL